MELQDSRNEYFMQLYEPHHASSLTYAKRLTGNADAAHDLLQEALETALKKFGTLRNADSFKPWLFRVMRNRYLNRVRRDKLAERFSFHVSRETCTGIEDRTAERIKLLDSMTGLTDEEQEALVLFEVEGFGIREIAKLQRRSMATIKYRLRRARAKLRDAYFDEPPPSPSARTIPTGDE